MSKLIIGVSGFIGAGKDTLANHLTTFHHFKKMSFASSLKDVVSAVFSWDREMLEGATKTSREWREQRDEWWSNRLGRDITPRWVLQYWGTEVCRMGFHNDIWIASLEYKLTQTKDDVVISDVRFPNELNSIKNVGGITIRVNRGGQPIWAPVAELHNRSEVNTETWLATKRELEALKIHASEFSLVGQNFDYVIDNNGSIDELNTKINSLLEAHRQAQ